MLTECYSNGVNPLNTGSEYKQTPNIVVIIVAADSLSPYSARPSGDTAL